MERKTKIFIDFDGTIFNTELFRNRIFDVFEAAGFTDAQILREYKAECCLLYTSDAADE